MQTIFKRPAGPPPTPGKLLQAEHFQIAYVTNDIAQACDVFRKRYGISHFTPLDATIPAGGSVHIELAWAGGTMFELIQSEGPGTEFYTNRLPDSFAIRHHHLGYVVPDLLAWEALLQQVEDAELTIAMAQHIPGFLRYIYVEAPELDHYLEYFLLEAGGIQLFESVQAN